MQSTLHPHCPSARVQREHPRSSHTCTAGRRREKVQKVTQGRRGWQDMQREKALRAGTGCIRHSPQALPARTPTRYSATLGGCICMPHAYTGRTTGLGWTRDPWGLMGYPGISRRGCRCHPTDAHQPSHAQGAYLPNIKDNGTCTSHTQLLTRVWTACVVASTAEARAGKLHG